jgi:UDP-N-acetylmuramoylalanine--D-glutamate ligase
MGLGLFGGGVGAARYFALRGARVTVTDTQSAANLQPSVDVLRGLPITFHLGGHQEADFTQAAILAVSPAVPKSSPYLAMAEKAGAEITSEMNLFMAACPAAIVGITGSNGKSTTTSLMGDMLGRDRPTRVGGNIGKSLLDELDAIRPGDTIVLELSSFQLEDLARLRRSPDTAIVTNLSPNHLDRHGTMAAYIDAKKNILRFQSSRGTAVLNADDALVRSWKAEAPGRVVFFSARTALDEGVFADGATVVFRLGGREERLDLTGRMTLRGRHNMENVLAAAAAARGLGVSADRIGEAVAAFRPLAHRLEPVGERGGVLYINDSKATTPLAAVVALEAFEAPVILIAGGYDKHSDPAPLVEAIRRRAKAALLIGATAAALEKAIGQGGSAGGLIVERAGGLEEAVRRAAALAVPGDVVLLAPGHASWDMFKNYEERGDLFRHEVEAMSEP